MKSESLSDILLCIASLANTSGGHLLIGAKEFDGQKGVLESFVSIGESPSSIVQRINDGRRDSIHPAIPGVRVECVNVDAIDVIVVSVPRSYLRPHVVSSDSRFRYATRNDHGLDPANYYRFKEAILSSEGMMERIRIALASGHSDFVDAVRHYGRANSPGAMLFQAIPMSGHTGEFQPDLRLPMAMKPPFYPEPDGIPRFLSSHGQYRYCLDGVAGAGGQVLFRRNGAIWCWREEISHRHDPAQRYAVNDYVVELLKSAMKDCIDAFQAWGADGQVVFSCSFANMKGLVVPTSRFGKSHDHIPQDDFTLPEEIVEVGTVTEDRLWLLAASFVDYVAQAAGCARFPRPTSFPENPM